MSQETPATNSASGRSLLVASMLAGTLLVAASAGAATYHVDFDGGDDGAAGTSQKAAWKHAPGDPNAAGKPKAAELKPGDTVRFKGGVSYRGSVVCRWSGEQGRPIVFDGNSDGSWGDGLAVLDGSEPLSGWRPAESAEECRGNSHWKNLVVGSVPADVDLRTLNLCQGEHLLSLSMSPSGRTVIAYGESEELSILDLLLMSEIEMSPASGQHA